MQLEVRVLPLGSCASYRYVVVFVRYQSKWMFARHKARDTWETAGGHIEEGETPFEAARRELERNSNVRLTLMNMMQDASLI